MITKFQKFNLITESPDKLYYNDGNNYNMWYNSDAIGFFVTVNSDHTQVEKLYVSRPGRSHDTIEFDGENKAYAGRIWKNEKMIAFWVYPNEVLFRAILEELESELGLQIFDNNWQVEIIRTEDDKIRMSEPDDDIDLYFGTRDNYGDINAAKEFELIPVEDYIGSEDVPEEQLIQHLMKWQDKELAKKLGKMHFPKGFGSDKTAWDSPHNIKWRQAKYQENKIYK